MATSVTLPALGESVTEGTVTQWLKQVGDTVAVDEPLLEISTDKVDTEIPSPVAGVLLEIKAAEDETVEVGAVLAIIGEEGESAGDDAAPAEEAPAPEAETAQDPEPAAAEETPAAEPEPATEPEPAPVAEERSAAPAETADAEHDAAESAPAPQAEAAPASTGGGTAVTLPALGESVTEGTVTQWLKQVGDDVAVDEPLLEISTDKVDTEIPSPVAGKLLEIKVAEDETVEVGAELAIIGTGESAEAAETAPAAADPQPAADPEPVEAPNAPAAPEPTPEPEPADEPEPAPAPTPEPAPAPTPEPAKPETQATPEPAAAAPAPTASAAAGSTDSYVTPIVRKLAKQHGVDLAAISGTGVGGRIRKQDVVDAAAAQPAEAASPAAAASTATPDAPSPLRGKTEKLTRLRKTIATRMLESLQISAQLTTVVEVDVTEIARLRARTKDSFLEHEGVKLSFLPFFAKAAIEALKTYPQVNSSIDMEAGTVTYPDGEHLGVAVDTERGLLVPVIKDAGDLSIAGLARKINDVAERTRTNKILPDELSGGTFTLTNTGSRGALFDTPIINQPQVAILGTGAVVKRPVVITDPHIGESIAVRQMMYLALTYDHRIVDGADAARFLTAIKDRLEGGNFEDELGS